MSFIVHIRLKKMGGVDYVTQFKTAESFRWHGTYLSTFKLLTTTYILHFFFWVVMFWSKGQLGLAKLFWPES